MRRMLLLLTTMTIAMLLAASVLSSLLVATSFFPHAAYAADAPSASASFECSDRRGGEFVLAITISGYPEGTYFDVYLDGVKIYGNAPGFTNTPIEIGGVVGTPFSLSPFVLPDGPHVITITQPQSAGGAVVHELPFVAYPCNPVEPQTKEDCKKGGYAKYGFKNQGQCIKAVKAPPDTTAPETTITAGPEQYSTSQNESATFEFTSSEANSTFECKITSQSFGQAIKGGDVGFWPPCTSPMTYSPLRDDNITFQVRAIDAAGNVDPTPAETIFTVQRPGPSLQITNGPEDRSTIDADSVTFEWTTDGATPVDSYCQFRGPSGWIELFNSCSSPKTYQLIEHGYYVFNVFVEDATGNSTSLERQFAVDTSSS